MITPSFGLTATERVLPKLALDFTTAVLDSRVTFTRTTDATHPATYINSSGVIASATNNQPRFDYDPTTLVCKGLLIEESRTNLLLNSLINGTILNTQIVVTTAVAHTLSFYGTGNIVLSGSSSSTVTGTGIYPSRKTYTFTPSAGALTLTVSGTVQYAQLEVGAFATSYIPTTSAALTRNADVATMTGTNFSSWYNASEGSFVAWADFIQGANPLGDSFLLNINNSADALGKRFSWFRSASTEQGGRIVVVNTTSQVNLASATTLTANTTYKFAYGYLLNNFAFYRGSTQLGVDTSCTMPTVDQAFIGCISATSSFTNGHIAKILYYPQRLSNAELAATSK